MPRMARNAPGGLVYHVLNRANGRLRLFKTEKDFLAFERVLLLAHRRTPIRILDWCVMSNHWHLVLWPERDGQLTEFVRWLTLTHAQRWKHAHAAVGHGHLYQGRFKSFPIEQDDHLLTVLRYVERNPVRAELVARAEDWAWSSVPGWRQKDPFLYRGKPPVRGPHWLRTVNAPLSAGDLQRLRRSVSRGRPFGDESWTRKTAERLGLESCLRPRGRPKKAT